MRVIKLVIATVLLLPAAAFAQTITSSFQTINASNAITVNIGKSLCQGNTLIDFKVDFTNAGSVPSQANGDTLNFYVTADTTVCSKTDAEPPGTAIPGTLDQTIVRTSVSIAELIKGLAGGCNDTTTSASNPYTVFFCSRRKSNSISGTTLIAVSFAVNFAMTGPKTPSGVILTPGDAHLEARWSSNDTNDRSWDVFAVPKGGTPDPNSPVTSGLQTTNVDIERTQGGAPLTNGAPYDVYVRSLDGYQNQSALSTPTTGTPLLIEDFYNRYRNKNGSDAGGGGCASGGAGALAVLGAALALLFRRRRKAGVLLGLLFVAAAPAARAEWHGQDRTPRRLLLAFKLDRYDPQIDSEAGLTGTPYHDIFHGHAPLRYQLEADWEVAHPLGSILVGGTVGFWQNYGHGLVPGTSTASSDTTHLNIAPFGVVVTYRFDTLADRFRWFPAIPYVQAGLMSALWTSYNGRGDVSSQPAGAGHGSGWSYGYTTALGVAFSLDNLDPQLAREAYLDAGVQRTALFAEYGWTRLDEFRKGGALILSDRAWRFGISVEF